MTNNDQLTPQQHEAIFNLITMGSVVKAAKATGVARSTLYNWLKDPAFKQALNQAETEALSELRRKLLSMGNQATEVIVKIMTSRKAKDVVKLRASDITLRRLLQISELATIEERLAAIEEALSGKDKQP